MLELVESQVIGGSPVNAGTVSLSRKGGVPRLFVKSSLLENYFKMTSRGETMPKPDRVFGTTLYRIALDSATEQEFLNETNILLQGADAFFGNHPQGGTWFNLAFLRTVGITEGIHFPIHTMLPIKLIESGQFAKACRQGISKLLKEFIVDFETEIQFSYRSKVE
jgi:hypothetical protein